MELKQEELKKLPGVDKLLLLQEVKELIAKHNDLIVKSLIRATLDNYRREAIKSNKLPDLGEIISMVNSRVQKLTTKSFRNVINATGVVVHTNLGRAPFSEDIIQDASEVLKGYNNLEFDLDKGVRGSRNTHLEDLLRYLTGAEDVLLVNNNAAAVMLVLKSFANRKEVIVSRGELIEIGGSFRLPDIMAASGCKMIEVGTTNKTSIRDYANAMTPSTRLLLKAHKSNYAIHGFTQEAELNELVALGKKYSIPVVYDMGSGLLRKTGNEVLKDEPDVKETLAKGVDIVTFSGDKLVGSDQAGIIAGKKEYISKLKKEPILRALRVGKTTLAYMQAALSYYLDDKILIRKNLLFSMLTMKPETLMNKANMLQSMITKLGVKSSVVESFGQCGGGALPDKEIKSNAVRIDSPEGSGRKKSQFAEKMYYALMHHNVPVVAILRKGDIYFDILTIPEEQFDDLIEAIQSVHFKIAGR
jgi:L-seryl-tRNA(Ser) seleniumtransferase